MLSYQLAESIVNVYKLVKTAVATMHSAQNTGQVPGTALVKLGCMVTVADYPILRLILHIQYMKCVDKNSQDPPNGGNTVVCHLPVNT